MILTLSSPHMYTLSFPTFSLLHCDFQLVHQYFKFILLVKWTVLLSYKTFYFSLEFIIALCFCFIVFVLWFNPQFFASCLSLSQDVQTYQVFDQFQVFRLLHTRAVPLCLEHCWGSCPLLLYWILSFLCLHSPSFSI